MSIETVGTETLAADRPAGDRWMLQWSPIVAGALAACAASFIMLTFGATVGLGVSSAAPTWRDASVALWVLSGIYLVVQALISFGCGGYFTGRCRLPANAASIDETETRDGLNGVACWALAVVLGAALAGLVTTAARPTHLAQPQTATEPSVLSYEIDHLFRAARKLPSQDLAPVRAEASRILLTSSSHSGVSSDDRTYLVQLVTATTGLAGQEADRRVDTAIANSRTAIHRARASTIVLAFSIATALLFGAAAAWAGAEAGGRHRDGAPLTDWMRHANHFNRQNTWARLPVRRER
jgi:hypothetical protein